MKTPDALLPALRQYQHNDCSGLISGFEHKETCKIITGLQAKLRELAEGRAQSGEGGINEFHKANRIF